MAQQWFRGDSVERTLRLWGERSEFLEVLDSLPHSLCHHDAFRRNLFIRRQPDGRDETVAVDWEIVGKGAIGEEIATLVGVSLASLEFPICQVNEMDAIVFESYVNGLRDVGWDGDERLVRFGFAAAAALFSGVGAAGIYLRALLRDDSDAIIEKVLGCTREYLVDQYAIIQDYLLALGDEARKLMAILT